MGLNGQFNELGYHLKPGREPGWFRLSRVQAAQIGWRINLGVLREVGLLRSGLDDGDWLYEVFGDISDECVLQDLIQQSKNADRLLRAE